MQISKLEVRILMAIAILVVGILAVVIVPRLVGSAPAAQSAVGSGASAPAPSTIPTPTLAPTPISSPTAKTEQQILDDIVASTVSVYSMLVCNSLDEYAALSVPEIISKVLAEYPTSGLSGQSRQIMAERVLTESAAKSCADQSPRVAAGIQG
ncbi:hypothetical protein [Cryobacterium sp. Hh38]|uniref:hypothetical protein n=1 Tax=Cryobacterium sp. Hh38 TaxID=1259156 RepID=UPI001069E669|nr:hypothetical protein [Cryobacterium sp. Hh38]TFD58224.1 hypothetical protein E3T41_11805 [Cryobacterium sp. Hh38]